MPSDAMNYVKSSEFKEKHVFPTITRYLGPLKEDIPAKKRPKKYESLAKKITNNVFESFKNHFANYKHLLDYFEGDTTEKVHKLFNTVLARSHEISNGEIENAHKVIAQAFDDVDFLKKLEHHIASDEVKRYLVAFDGNSDVPSFFSKSIPPKSKEKRINDYLKIIPEELKPLLPKFLNLNVFRNTNPKEAAFTLHLILLDKLRNKSGIIPKADINKKKIKRIIALLWKGFQA